jgi:transitional endoplasmic reticulum ATPase
VRETFRKARQAAPSVIFLDEIDSIVPARGGSTSDSHVTERVISQILTELDGLESLNSVMVIAATNRPDIIDSALLRPGRFDRLIEIGLPDELARREILKIHTAKKPLADDVKIDDLAKRTDQFSGADLGALVGEAVMLAIRECVLGGKATAEAQVCEYKLENKHFEEALKKVKPTASEADIYKRFAGSRAG